MPKRPIIARTALPGCPPDDMTMPAGATAGKGEARPTSTADHGTGHDLEDARHPPPAPRGTAVTARRRSSRFSGTLVRDRAPVFRRGLLVPVSRDADRSRGPLAPRSAPSRSARPRRLRPRISLGRRDSRPPARPPTSPRLPAPAHPSAGLPPRLAPWARPSGRGIAMSGGAGRSPARGADKRPPRSR